MAEQLPRGWVKTTLGEIAEPWSMRSLPTEVHTMRYVGLEHIEPQTMRLLKYGDALEARSSSSSLRFSKGDVLYGKMRPYLNKVWVAEFDGLCSNEFLVFQKSVWLNSHFLALRLNAQDFVAFATLQISGERPRVDFKKLASFPVLLPPLAEQERIIAKLDDALRGVERAQNAAGRARERLEAYRAAVLQAALTGELTRDWREGRRQKGADRSETGDGLVRHLLAERRRRWEEAQLARLRKKGKAPKDERWKARYVDPEPPNITDLGRARVLDNRWSLRNRSGTTRG